MRAQNFLLGTGLAAGLLIAVVPGRAEDPTLPTFRSYAGAFLAGHDHNFLVESDLQLPLIREAGVTFYYRHRETTPFLDLSPGVQAEVLYGRDELQADFRLCDGLRLIALGGYHRAQLEDRPGLLSAYAMGGGIGSPLRTDGARLHWHALAGAYADRRDLRSDWWTDLAASWRAFYFLTDAYLGSTFHASLQLAARVESSNVGGRFQSLTRVGPQLQFLTANGNRANLELEWYHNDDHPLYGSNENGLLFGLDVVSSRDDAYVFHARQQRQPGWFPMVWGAYDVGVGDARNTSRFEMNVEVVDLTVADHLVTGTIWYETHSERRAGDFDNISYSVTLGVQTPLGWESILSQGNPLVVGMDFLHRSDHALNPDADRVAALGFLRHGSLNLLPRFRLQTIGWDLPYRDPAMYERRSAWLNYLDWRVTAGLDANSSRDRFPLAAQIGMNWDVATVQGFVVYARGVASAGNETPDWLAELGVRRPAIKLFTRYESYGINQNIARGTVFVVGAGVYL